MLHRKYRQPAGEISAFQRRVYAALQRVPAGRVTSYAALAAAIGCRSPRAVGQALRCNPFAPAVPCHRVIAADGRLGGFQGRRAGAALRRKRALLAAEGVLFHAGKLVDQERLLNPADVVGRGEQSFCCRSALSNCDKFRG